MASELVDNAVRHAGTGCRLTLRYNAFGLTLAVRDDRPHRMPEPPPVDPEPVGAENPVTSCDLHILMYETTEPVSSQRPGGRAGA